MINYVLIHYFLLYFCIAHPETDLKNLIFAVSILLFFFHVSFVKSHSHTHIKVLWKVMYVS